MRTVQQPTSPAQAESTRLRLTFLSLLVVSLFILLFARLWFLQVMAGEHYLAQAQGLTQRTLSIEAPRGWMYDREGRPLVENRWARVVGVRASEMGDRRDEVLDDLSQLLQMPLEDIEARLEDQRVHPLRPKPIAIDVPQEIDFYIHENRSTRFPGVYLETVPVRDYPQETTAAHIAGYLGQISPERLEDPEWADYRPGDVIGWAGLEARYERVLRGGEGLRIVEVNPRGEVVQQLNEILPTRGADLTLTLDLNLQTATEEALRTGIQTARDITDEGEGHGRGGQFRAPAGAAVVLDARNGEVLAMASYPTFDPADFIGGLSVAKWEFLKDPASHFPLINRVVQSRYPPGSVFKVVPAAAALEDAYMSQGSELDCPGAWTWNENTYRNWTRSDSGSMNLAAALEHSCDTVFYELARRMWTDEEREKVALADDEFPRERLSRQAQAWGFGALTGIDVPGETGGAVPGREWKRAFWERIRHLNCAQAEQSPPGSYAWELFTELCSPEGARWRGGDAVNMSIGQGDVQTTPLQIANAFAAIANRGTLHQPRVVREIAHPDGTVEVIEPEVIGRLPVSRSNLDYIEHGLLRVTATGTASSVFGDFPAPIAGKTGTAEMKPKQPSAWFAGYNADGGTPYVVVAMVEEGGGGSQTAAPIVRRIFEAILGLTPSDFVPGEATD